MKASEKERAIRYRDEVLIEIKNFYHSCIPEHLRPKFKEVKERKQFEALASEVDWLKESLEYFDDGMQKYLMRVNQYKKRAQSLILKVNFILLRENN